MSLLPDAESFRRLVDGTDRGPGPALARLALAGLAVPYGLAIAARNAAYDRGLLAVIPPPVPVISVGNLTLGGTGKTPLVAWMARALWSRGLAPAIVSRGYGARPGERSDEAAELGLLLPGVVHVANRDRVAAARAAAQAGADAIVLDDGFQHRRLGRHLDLVAVDATDPFGCGRLFPRGLLREPLGGLARADAVILTRSTAVDAARRAAIRAALEQRCHGRLPAVWCEAAHRPAGLRQAGGATRPLDDLRGARCFGFAGIGNPAAFRATLASLGAEPVGFRAFPDHHAYTPADIEAVGEAARAARAEAVVTTLKDLVKIGRDEINGLPLLAVEIAIDLLAGGDALAALVAGIGRRGPTVGDR